jgi:hypothetical protein
MVRESAHSKHPQYGISMLHQSHWVDMLRAALFGGEHDHDLHFRRKRDVLREGDELDGEHLEHCLDYIAQVGPWHQKDFGRCPSFSDIIDFRVLYALLMTQSRVQQSTGRKRCL